MRGFYSQQSELKLRRVYKITALGREQLAKYKSERIAFNECIESYLRKS